MADRENALGKKTIIAIIAVIVLLFIAGISVGIFLADKGSSEAVDGNQVADVNQNTDANNTNTENQKNDDNNVNSENKQNENIQAENNNNQTGENSTPDNTNIATKPDTGVQNNVTTPNNNDGTVANNGTTNNNVTANNGETDNNVTNNTEITTGTNVNEVGETTVTRVEEEEKLVSKDFWDWWTPASVLATAASAVSDTIVPTTPDFTVEKFATTKSGENVVYAGENITYTIKVTNNGEKDLNNIEITDKIPENTTFVSFDDAFNIIKGKTVIGENDEVVGVKWIVSVPGHKENEDTNSVFVRFTVNVNKMMLVEMDDGEIAEVPTTGTIANTAIANGQESNEEKTAIITSNKTSEITRDGSKVEVAKIGDEITYTIKVTNTGEVDGVTTISDNVPTGTILKENSAEGAIISENNTKLEWKNVTVPAGESVSKTFIVIVDNFDDLTENKITNVATVGGKETDEVEDPIAIDITVSKDWKDANDQDGYRPEEIYVNLLTDGKVKTTVKLKADEQGNWSYVFENLPKFENGKEIVYTVTENDVEKYTTEITGSVTDGFVITNTHTPELVNETGRIEVSKDWKDANDQDGYRPEEIYVNLLTDGKVKTTVKLKADEQGNWSYVFENLPKFENGKEIVYTVTENDVEKYTTEITGSVTDGFVITNTHTPELVNETGRIEVSKDWKDANDQDGYRPEEIYVNLLTDGKVKTTVKLKADEQGNWSYVFENLPKFENGKEIVYTVTENDVEKYTTEITGSVADGFTITNTHTPTTKNVVLTKIWDDNGDELKKRPGSVTFKINNKNYVLSALKDEDKTTLNEWTLTVKVPINNTDTVSEVPVKGYTTIYGEDGLTVTNQIMQPGKVTINSLKQSSEKINAPMDVVFVLDTSNSMSEKSSRYDENNKAQNMVNAVNNTISNIMSLNPDSRVGIVGYAGWKENNNNDYSEHPSVIVPLDNYKTIKGNYISLSGNVINVNDSITKGESRTITGGTYTQAGIKLGAEQLIKGSESKTYTGKTKDGLDYTTTRVPMLVLVTDGVPTYYIKADNAQIVEGNGWQPGINVKGDGQETNVTSDYYYWTIRTAKYYKDEVTKAYYGENSKNTSKVFTIGIGLNNNNRAKVMLNPNKDTIDAQLRRNDGLYIKLQENDNNPYKYDYAEASTTTAVTSGELEEFLEESIFGSLPNLPTIRTITAEETTSRKIYLPNIDTNKEFKLIIGTNTYNTFKEASAYIKGDATSGYYVDLTSVSKTATVEVSYWEIFTGTNS